jgi:hypothetical protein
VVLWQCSLRSVWITELCKFVIVQTDATICCHLSSDQITISQAWQNESWKSESWSFWLSCPTQNNMNRNKTCNIHSHCPGAASYVIAEVRWGITYRVNSFKTSGQIFLWEFFFFLNAIFRQLGNAWIFNLKQLLVFRFRNGDVCVCMYVYMQADVAVTSGRRFVLPYFHRVTICLLVLHCPSSMLG